MSDDNVADLCNVINTNLFGTLFCTKIAYKMMQKNDSMGHIINVNSILGHGVPKIGGQAPITNVYPSTKHAITAMTEVLRQELNYMENKKVKVSVSPMFCF